MHFSFLFGFETVRFREHVTTKNKRLSWLFDDDDVQLVPTCASDDVPQRKNTSFDY